MRKKVKEVWPASRYVIKRESDGAYYQFYTSSWVKSVHNACYFRTEERAVYYQKLLLDLFDVRIFRISIDESYNIVQSEE